jgi:hypothetical protein
VKFNLGDLALFALIVVGALSIGLVLGVGHFFWPGVLLIAGAYLLGKASQYLFSPRSSPTRNPKDRDQ